MKMSRLISTTLILVASFYPSLGFSEDQMRLGVIADISNEASDENFQKIARQVEFLEAKRKLAESQQGLLNIVQGGAGEGEASSNNGGGPKSIPRPSRGSSDGDVYINSAGEEVVVEKRPTAFISSVSGMSGNLTAELYWADRVMLVRKGDSVVGGNWKVQSVSNDNITIQGPRSQVIRIGMLPVFIDQITGS